MFPAFQMMAQRMQSNPLFQRAMQMAEGKSPEELRQIAQNLCDNRGINMEQAFEQFKNQLTGMPGNSGMNR